MKNILAKLCCVIVITWGLSLEVAVGRDPLIKDKTTIKNIDGKWHVSGPTLNAYVEMDGTMSKLFFPLPGEWLSHVPNFLKIGIGLPHENGARGSHGAFFYQKGKVLSLPDIKAESESILLARGDKASVRYEFRPDKQIWTLTNKTEAVMQYLLVLDSGVNVVSNKKFGYRSVPANELWDQATLFQNGKRKVDMVGLSRIWAPGEFIGKGWRDGYFQICEVTIGPKESKTLTIKHGGVTKNESIAVSEFAKTRSRGTPPNMMIAPKPSLKGKLNIFSPRQYQVFQRHTKYEGEMLISGNILPKCDSLQVRITGQGLKGTLKGDWQDIPINKYQNFNSKLPVAAGGWYKVEFRTLLKGVVVARGSLNHVGIGEVFVGCGQSNSTNYGEAPTKTKSRMVSTFSGTDWRVADDPQPGTHDSSKYGSFWPAFGDAIYKRYKVPVGVAVTGHGGAPVRHWKPGSLAFHWTMTRIIQLGPNGFRGLLWHQGGTDARIKSTADYYYKMLSEIIEASRSVSGWHIPWFVAQATYRDPKNISDDEVRRGQELLWHNSVALQGPDTDLLGEKYRVGAHFTIDGLKLHGEMWADKVSPYIDSVLSE